MSRPSARPDAAVPAETVQRFRADVEGVIADGEAVALAVSGGPDSLALLLLAAVVFPGRLLALTVDHGLRAESADEAAMVARLCAERGIPHRTLTVPQLQDAKANIQAEARAARYAAMAAACKGDGVRWLLTAHHADDQAETLLMRLGRGSGLAGLAGVRTTRRMDGVTLFRPLLGWRKAELAAIVAGAGLEAVDDPSNRSPAYDRTAARALMQATAWLDPLRLAASAAHLAQAEEALQWTAEQAWRGRADHLGGVLLLDVEDLPPELVRRLVLKAIAVTAPDAAPDGPSVERLIGRLLAGRDSTLAGVRVRHGRKWRFDAAPPRNG